MYFDDVLKILKSELIKLADQEKDKDVQTQRKTDSIIILKKFIDFYYIEGYNTDINEKLAKMT